MSILSKKKTSTLWILLVQGGSYSYKVELTFTIDQRRINVHNRRRIRAADKKLPAGYNTEQNNSSQWSVNSEQERMEKIKKNKAKQRK